MTAKAEVIVVGGGPAGAATAAWLAQQGRDVLVLEKALFPREKPCAEYLSPGVVAAIGRLGVLERLGQVDAAWPIGMRIIVGDCSFMLTYPDQVPARFGSQRPDRLALGLPRPVFDHILLEHARASGARICERTQVLGTITDGEHVVGVLARGPDGESDLRAKIVVGADGCHSVVARSLGLDRPVRWPNRLGLVARYQGPHCLKEHGEMHVGRGLYCGLAPVGADLVNVGLVVGMGARPSTESATSYFERTIGSLPGVARSLGAAKRVTPVRGTGPLARRVSRAAGPGYLLVGDAAGFLDPFTGEGIFRALRGAELAAAAIAEALARPDYFPTGYEPIRRAAFDDKERVCRLVQLFLTSIPAFAYVIRRLAKRPAAAAILAGVLGDYRPASQALQPSYLWKLLAP